MKAKSVSWGQQAPSAKVTSERAISAIRGGRVADVQDKADKHVAHHKETAAYVGGIVARKR